MLLLCGAAALRHNSAPRAAAPRDGSGDERRGCPQPVSALVSVPGSLLASSDGCRWRARCRQRQPTRRRCWACNGTRATHPVAE
ncbi:hypothetical protein ACFPRL_24510 [Pseudoclavibacter helvolus]